MIKTKRIYDKPEKNDGFRILVDRLWPRGIKKEKAKIGLWLKDIAPSNKLRKWFSHKEERWNKFKQCYFSELKHKAELIKKLKGLMKKQNITFLYAAKDEEKNNAKALLDFIRNK